MVDPRTILFSIPTLSNDAPPLTPFSGTPSATDVVFHEDDWRQIEFFASDRTSEVQRMLVELKTFEATHRAQSGWTDVYVRRVTDAPVIPGVDAVESVENLLSAPNHASPIVFRGAGSIDGRLRDGFSLRLGPGAALYGVHNQAGISVLGAHLRNADDRLLTNAFAALNRRYGLVLVDWRSQMLLMSVEASGNIIVWSP